VSKTKKHLLGGFFYVVERVTEEETRVHKLAEDAAETEVYTIVDSECSCRAAQFGAECKHVEMSEDSLQGSPVAKRNVEAAFQDYLTRLQKSFPGSKIVSLLDYYPGREITRASAFAVGVLSEFCGKITLWAEKDGLLIRLVCFKEVDEYRQALRRVRTSRR
jgi:hypothetical protein